MQTSTMLEDGPRERLARVPMTSLSDAEVLALVLGTGTSHERVPELALRVLEERGGLLELARSGLGELATHRGIGHSKACRIAAAFELGRRAYERPLRRGARISSSRDLDHALRPRLALLEVEQFVVVALDARNRVLAESVVGMGTNTFCPVSPAEVLRAVLRQAGSAFVVAHNHPSGDPSPSPEDTELTRRLQAAAELVGLRLLDHVILARDGVFSFLDAGMLERGARG